MEERVIEIIKVALGVKNPKMGDELESDLMMDQLDLMELSMVLEEEFNVSVSDDDGRKWKTVGDVVEYIKKEVD